MRVKFILIELELGDTDRQDHATKLEFLEGAWTVNGSTYPRISNAMNEIFQLLRSPEGRFKK